MILVILVLQTSYMAWGPQLRISQKKVTPKTLGCEERKTESQPTEDILTNKNRDNQLRKAHVVKQLGIDIQWQLGGLPQEEANRGRELVMDRFF